MAFFSLTTQQEHQQRDQVGSDSLFLYRSNNEDNSFYKGFELWHPQQQQQQQQQFQEYNFYSSARDMPVGSGRGTSRKGHDDGYGLEMMMRGVEGGGGGGGGGVISCQDCGNQAKKDCIHMRCRTCCKSRGLDCQTHIKSTWVPASVRRDKNSHQQHLQVSGENSKRLRDKRPTSSSTGIQVNDFPPELTSTATFRCVRVSSIDDADEEYAYQTAVNIGGHVFKGILYDQGPDKDYNSVSTALETCTIGPAATPATALFESCINYPSPLGTFVSGAPFLYNPRS